MGRKTVPPGNLAEQVMYGMPTRHMIPTPVVPNGGRKHNLDSLTMVGNTLYRKDGSKAQLDLETYTRIYPTPTVNDAKNSTLPPSQINHDNLPGALLRDGEAPGGQLNPVWVEWLIGWPLNWTSLEPLSTDDFNQWVDAQGTNSWWNQEPDIPRVASDVKERVNRLKALGNGQVSICAFTAWQLLTE